MAQQAMATSAASLKPSVVNIGIGPQHPLIPDELRDKLRSAIEESRTLMREAGYDDFVSLAIDPDDKQQAIKALTVVLAEKHRYSILSDRGPLPNLTITNRAAVIIGGGLRKMPQMIPILEDIINTTKEISPKTQILFSEWPTGVLDSVKRLK